MISDSKLISIEAGHQINLIRFSNRLGRLSTPHLNRISEKVREILFKYEFITTKNLMNELSGLISEVMQKELNAFIAEFIKEERQLIKQEIVFQSDVLKTAVGVGVAVNKPTIKKTTALINSTPMVLNGVAVTVDEYIGDYTPNQIKKVKRAITAGWTNGLSTREIAQSITGTKTIKGIIQQSQSSAFRMAKDITSHASSMAKAEVAKDNDDLIIGEKAIVTLDSLTSPICQRYGSQDSGGKEWYYKKDGQNFPRAPYHPNCRTVMTYILADEYREIADEGNTRPAIIDGKAVQVPANTNWMDLAKKHPNFARESLGKQKASILNEMGADEFTRAAYNRMNKPLTLEQLEQKNITAVSS